MPAHRILMHSFKGGSGRSVTTANVAHVLAREMDQRVVCIDMDLESAGASVLFEAKQAVDQGKVWAVQDLVRGYAETAGQGTQLINIGGDFENTVWPMLHTEVFLGDRGYIRFCPARIVSSKGDEVSLRDPEAQSRFERLLRKLGRLDYPPDFVLYDSASGLQDAACTAMMNCDSMVIFTRWSRQFVIGTTEFLRKMVCSPRLSRMKRVFLVPTAVPRIPATGAMAARVEARQQRLYSDIRDINGTATREYDKGPEWIKLLDPIPECSGLKWDDRIFFPPPDDAPIDAETRGVMTAYRALAKALATP